MKTEQAIALYKALRRRVEIQECLWIKAFGKFTVPSSEELTVTLTAGEWEALLLALASYHKA